jgi:serine/threonine protein kinase
MARFSNTEGFGMNPGTQATGFGLPDPEAPAGCPKTGALLGDKYRLKQSLGHQGHLSVWLAVDEASKAEVLLKIAPELMASDPGARAEFVAKLSPTLGLIHPNIIRHLDLVDGEWLALVTEDILGNNLKDLLARQRNRFFETESIAVWVRQLCDALEFAHKGTGLKHGDLKLANLIIDSSGVLKVGDFVLDRVMADWLVSTGEELPAQAMVYRSPESLGGSNAFSDDVYSVGAVLYELLVGSPVFSGGNVRSKIISKVPQPLSKAREVEGRIGKTVGVEWETTVAACLSKEFDGRPETVGKINDLLQLPAPVSPRKSRIPFATTLGPLVKKAGIFGISAAGLTIVALGAYSWHHYVLRPAELARQAEAARLAEEKQIQEEKDRKAAEAAEAVRVAQEAVEREASAAREKEEQRLRDEAERLAKARGGLALQTRPARAQVTVGSLSPQPTPLNSLAIPVGKQRIEIQLTGYDSVVREVEIIEGQTTDLGVIELVRQTGSVSLSTTPEGAQVYFENKLVGKTPLDLDRVPTGRQFYELWMPGYDPQTFDAVVRKGERTRAALSLRRARGARPGVSFTNSLGMAMVWVPELEAWVARHETTQAEFFRLMEKNPSAYVNDRHPVENVSWEEAVEFCRRLQITEERRNLIGSNQRYRLPYEREWEVFVADATLLQAVTGLSAYGVKHTAPVGSKEPNRLGLFDVRGNVAEWCLDPYPGSEGMRILRGGSWLSTQPESLQVGARDYNGVKDRGSSRGFRVVMVHQFP